MKKVVLLGLVVAGVVTVYRALADQREQRDLWTEVTDPV
ncbi:MAG TPA: DLW-39 family protein [Actinotalea caeni]|nr:DLW-39 family protein [Actinotalea caeni]HLV57207.1 DLW-39 family protein [Actinotalea caeni]